MTKLNAEMREFLDGVKAGRRTTPLNDPRLDHRKMLVDAEARHWRVLGYVNESRGKANISREEGCHVSSVTRSYKWLKDRGYIELGAGRRLYLTKLGKEKLNEKDTVNIHSRLGRR